MLTVKEIHLSKNRIKNGLIILSILILAILFFYGFDWKCVIKSTIHIPCPGCGLTRSFDQIMNLNIIGSFNYSILGFPLFIFFIISFVMISIDFIKNKDSYLKFIYTILNKYYYIIILLLVLSWIINIIRGI